jgi:hypothetical protein
MPLLSPDRQLSWTAVSIGSGKTLRVGISNMSFRKNLPAESSWGVFGDNDAQGCLNFLTPEGVVEAARRQILN